MRICSIFSCSCSSAVRSWCTYGLAVDDAAAADLARAGPVSETTPLPPEGVRFLSSSSIDGALGINSERVPQHHLYSVEKIDRSLRPRDMIPMCKMPEPAVNFWHHATFTHAAEEQRPCGVLERDKRRKHNKENDDQEDDAEE